MPANFLFNLIIFCLAIYFGEELDVYYILNQILHYIVLLLHKLRTKVSPEGLLCIKKDYVTLPA
jgi:hypothetical protein